MRSHFADEGKPHTHARIDDKPTADQHDYDEYQAYSRTQPRRYSVERGAKSRIEIPTKIETYDHFRAFQPDTRVSIASRRRDHPIHVAHIE